MFTSSTFPVSFTTAILASISTDVRGLSSMGRDFVTRRVKSRNYGAVQQVCDDPGGFVGSEFALHDVEFADTLGDNGSPVSMNERRSRSTMSWVGLKGSTGVRVVMAQAYRREPQTVVLRRACQLSPLDRPRALHRLWDGGDTHSTCPAHKEQPCGVAGVLLDCAEVRSTARAVRVTSGRHVSRLPPATLRRRRQVGVRSLGWLRRETRLVRGLRAQSVSPVSSLRERRASRRTL